jgi:hypothetical protein
MRYISTSLFNGRPDKVCSMRRLTRMATGNEEEGAMPVGGLKKREENDGCWN